MSHGERRQKEPQNATMNGENPMKGNLFIFWGQWQGTMTELEEIGQGSMYIPD